MGVVAVGTIGGRLASWTSPDGRRGRHTEGIPKAPDGSRLDEDVVAVTDVVARDGGWLAVGRRDPACTINCDLDPKRDVWTSSDGAKWTRVADQKAFKGGGMDAVARGDDMGFAPPASPRAMPRSGPRPMAWHGLASRMPRCSVSRSRRDWAYAVGVTGAAERDGVIVVVGQAYAQDTCGPGVPVRRCPGCTGLVVGRRADVVEGRRSRRPVDGQLFGVTATPDGFLATGPSGGRSCLGGIWASTDGRAWRCDASSPDFKGFGPYAAAASDRVEVAVGLDDGGPDAGEDSVYLGAVWVRTRP